MIHRVIVCPAFPGKVYVYTCFQGLMINNSPLNSPKYPALHDELYCCPDYTDQDRATIPLYTLSQKKLLQPQTFKYLRIQSINIIFDFEPHVDATTSAWQAESCSICFSCYHCQDRTVIPPPPNT